MDKKLELLFSLIALHRSNRDTLLSCSKLIMAVNAFLLTLFGIIVNSFLLQAVNNNQSFLALFVVTIYFFTKSLAKCMSSVFTGKKYNNTQRILFSARLTLNKFYDESSDIIRTDEFNNYVKYTDKDTILKSGLNELIVMMHLQHDRAIFIREAKRATENGIISFLIISTCIYIFSKVIKLAF